MNFIKYFQILTLYKMKMLNIDLCLQYFLILLIIFPILDYQILLNLFSNFYYYILFKFISMKIYQLLLKLSFKLME
jgi:hypothetical protein